MCQELHGLRPGGCRAGEGLCVDAAHTPGQGQLHPSIAPVGKPAHLGAAPKPKQKMDVFGPALRASLGTVRH